MSWTRNTVRYTPHKMKRAAFTVIEEVRGTNVPFCPSHLFGSEVSLNSERIKIYVYNLESARSLESKILPISHNVL